MEKIKTFCVKILLGITDMLMRNLEFIALILSLIYWFGNEFDYRCYAIVLLVGFASGISNSYKRDKIGKLSPLDYFFNRWTKWEIYKSDIPYKKATYASPILGSYQIGREKSVMVDIYVKENKFTGIKKYKQVIKYR
jgi:hypothetical protein